MLAVVAEGNGAVPLDQRAAEQHLPEAIERALAGEAEPAAQGSRSAPTRGVEQEQPASKAEVENAPGNAAGDAAAPGGGS